MLWRSNSTQFKWPLLCQHVHPVKFLTAQLFIGPKLALSVVFLTWPARGTKWPTSKALGPPSCTALRRSCSGR